MTTFVVLIKAISAIYRVSSNSIHNINRSVYGVVFGRYTATKRKRLTGVFKHKVRAVLSHADCSEPTANNILLKTWLHIIWLVAATEELTKK